MDLPKISVIVCAHNRHEYLTGAVKSVLEQTLPRKFYEMVVVKNFIDDQIDQFLKESEVKNIFTNEKELGKKMIIGVENSSGNMITFLDDDDLYFRERLERLREILEYSPEIDFYHNSYIEIDESGDTISTTPQLKKSKLYRSGRRNILILAKFKKYRLSHNNSCIAVSRGLFEKSKAFLTKSIDSTDDALFLLSIVTNANIFADSMQLTQYRVHSSYTHFLGTEEEYYKKLHEKIVNFRQIADVMKESYVNKTANMLVNSYLEEVLVDPYIKITEIPSFLNIISSILIFSILTQKTSGMYKFMLRLSSIILGKAPYDHYYSGKVRRTIMYSGENL